MFSVLPVENKIGDCCCWYGEFGLSPMKKNQSNVPTDIFFGIRMGYGIHPVFTNELTQFLELFVENAFRDCYYQYRTFKLSGTKQNVENLGSHLRHTHFQF